jgi:DNA-binding NtrC family response regulator
MTKVFIVEDDEDLSEIYRGVLERAGMEVEVSMDGLDASRRIVTAESAPDAVLLDLHLPGQSGYQVFEQITARWPEIKVLVITADQTMATALDAQIVETHPVCVLIKPVPIAKLPAVINKYLEASEV